MWKECHDGASVDQRLELDPANARRIEVAGVREDAITLILENQSAPDFSHTGTIQILSLYRRRDSPGPATSRPGRMPWDVQDLNNIPPGFAPPELLSYYDVGQMQHA